MFANVASAFGFGTSSSSTAKPKDEGTFEAQPKEEGTMKGRQVIENLADATLESMNHYEVLGLHWEASKTEIIKAYREMARMWYLDFSLGKFLTSGTEVVYGGAGLRSNACSIQRGSEISDFRHNRRTGWDLFPGGPFRLCCDGSLGESKS